MFEQEKNIISKRRIFIFFFHVIFHVFVLIFSEDVLICIRDS